MPRGISIEHHGGPDKARPPLQDCYSHRDMQHGYERTSRALHAVQLAQSGGGGYLPGSLRVSRQPQLPGLFPPLTVLHYVFPSPVRPLTRPPHCPLQE
jgi:hypothetical protein